MKSLFIQKNIVLIILFLFLFSSVVGACQLFNEKIINYSENPVSDIYGNSPPDTPDIYGPIIGKPGKELEYTIVSTDPESNDIVYCYDWGDDSGEVCIGPYPSGEVVTISHTWFENGTYTITVKASDILGEESGIATLKVKISTSRNNAIIRVKLIEMIHLLKIIKNKIIDLSL